MQPKTFLQLLLYGADAKQLSCAGKIHIKSIFKSDLSILKEDVDVTEQDSTLTAIETALVTAPT